MPDIKDIDELKNTINSLGNENEILAERGEIIEDIPMPESGISDDLNELLGSSGFDSDESPESGESDMSALMGSFKDSSSEGEIDFDSFNDSDADFSDMNIAEDQSAGDEQGLIDDISADDFQLSDLGDEDSGLNLSADESPEQDEFSLPQDMDFGAVEDNEPPAASRRDESPDDFTLPEGLLDGDDFALPEEPENQNEKDAVAEPAATEDFSLNEESFMMPEEDVTSDEASVEENINDDFSIPDNFETGLEEGSADSEEIISDDTSAENTEDESSREEIFEEVFEEELDEEESPVAESEELSEISETEEEEAPVEDGYSLEDIQAAIAEESAIAAGDAAPPSGGFPYAETDDDEDELSFDDLSSSDEIPQDEFSLPVGFPFNDSGAATEEPSETPGEELESEESVTGDFDLADISDEGFSIPEGLDLGGDGKGSDDDTFSLGTLGEEFLGADFSVAEESLNPANDISGDLFQADESFDLSDQDFDEIKKRLASLPRNLKLVIEEQIGEKGLSGDNLKKLIAMLIEGDSLKSLAAFAGRLSGKKIKIPAYYEKRTALEYQLEKASFSYRFVHVLLPRIAIGLVVSGLVFFILLMTFEFVYKPIHASILYHKGIVSINETKYKEGNQYFDRALTKWRQKSQFFKYAGKFTDKKQYRLAAEKYDQLLSFYPGDKKGILSYADLESRIRNDYPKAENLLKQLLFTDLYNFDALLASGNNYLEWARQDSSKYEEARLSYAILLEKYGRKPELLFGMMKYFMRTDKYNEVINLKNEFQDMKKLRVDPNVYAELGAYLIDKKDFNDVRSVLFMAMKEDGRLPEIYYHLARFYKITGYSAEELDSLKKTAYLMEKAHRNTQERLEIHIDTYNRMGENYFNAKEYLEAEDNLNKALSLYESYKDNDFRIEAKDKFGKIYSNLADIYYFVSGDYDLALDLYNKAEKNKYLSDALEYKRGYIYYSKQLYKEALEEFYNAADPFDKSTNVILSTADSLYKRSDFFAAEGYYRTLISVLETKKNSIPVLRPDEKIEHRELLENLMMAYNNLGVTLYRLSSKTKNRSEKYSQALVYLTESSEIFDVITREPETMERSDTINLAYLNTRAIIYPSAENIPEIYARIPKELR